MSRPLEAFGAALARTRHVLFEPFDAGKYLALAFCIWLFRLGSAGGTSGPRGGPTAAAPPEFDPASVQEALASVLAMGALLGVIVAAGLVVAVVCVAIVLFLQSRGAFLAIDGIVKNRGAVREPWAEFATDADRLFRFRLVVALAALAAGLVLAGAAAAALWPFTGEFTGLQIGVLAAVGLVGGLVGAAAGIVDALATEFVAPLLYARRYTVAEGFRDLRALLGADLRGFALYVLLRLAASFGVTLIGAAMTCATCGLVLLPFVGTLILLPAFLFLRTCSLEYLANVDPGLAAVLRPA